jgi:hypothetical protein
MNTEMFLRITKNIADVKMIKKSDLIISGIDLLPLDINNYFKKIPIKRNRAMVDMKKGIAELILNVHNEKYVRNKDLCFTLTEIANILDIKSHASVLSYFKNKKMDDKLSVFVKDNFIRWISEKKYPIPFRQFDKKDCYVLINQNELETLEFTSDKKMKSEHFFQFTNLKKREYFIND